MATIDTYHLYRAVDKLEAALGEIETSFRGSTLIRGEMVEAGGYVKQAVESLRQALGLARVPDGHDQVSLFNDEPGEG